MNRCDLRRLGLLAVGALLAAACSSTVVVGGPSTTVDIGSSTTAHEVSLSDLVGNWDNGELFLQVSDDGSFQVLEASTSSPAEPLMGGFLARDGVNINFVTDIYGECAGQTGVYEVLMTEVQLMLILVEDPCEFRATRFVEPWAKSD